MVIDTKIEAVVEKKARVLKEVAYKFRDEGELSEAQLTDPDYSDKVIFGEDHEMKVCSKCHHCR